ncbi:MAG: hypothetical protein Q8P67_03670 [archaeon]|nr:hypothetical protein [archaeon]
MSAVGAVEEYNPQENLTGGTVSIPAIGTTNADRCEALCPYLLDFPCMVSNDCWALLIEELAYLGLVLTCLTIVVFAWKQGLLKMMGRLIGGCCRCCVSGLKCKKKTRNPGLPPYLPAARTAFWNVSSSKMARLFVHPVSHKFSLRGEFQPTTGNVGLFRLSRDNRQKWAWSQEGGRWVSMGAGAELPEQVRQSQFTLAFGSERMNVAAMPKYWVLN